MNKVLVVAVTEEGRGSVTAGGIELETELGLRDALAMAEFARAQLTEGLVQVRARALAEQEKGEDDDEG